MHNVFYFCRSRNITASWSPLWRKSKNTSRRKRLDHCPNWWPSIWINIRRLQLARWYRISWIISTKRAGRVRRRPWRTVRYTFQILPRRIDNKWCIHTARDRHQYRDQMESIALCRNTQTETGIGIRVHCFLFYQSHFLYRFWSQFRAVWISHKILTKSRIGMT